MNANSKHGSRVGGHREEQSKDARVGNNLGRQEGPHEQEQLLRRLALAHFCLFWAFRTSFFFYPWFPWHSICIVCLKGGGKQKKKGANAPLLPTSRTEDNSPSLDSVQGFLLPCTSPFASKRCPFPNFISRHLQYLMKPTILILLQTDPYNSKFSLLFHIMCKNQLVWRLSWWHWSTWLSKEIS